MKWSIATLFLLFLTSCSWDVETKPINGNGALSDGNSKVWLVDHLFKKRIDYQQPEYFERDLIIFYVSGKCRILKWKDFGKMTGDLFYYRLIRNQNELPKLILIRKGKKWEFVFKTFTNDKMILSPINGTSFKYEITIIPLPEW